MKTKSILIPIITIFLFSCQNNAEKVVEKEIKVEKEIAIEEAPALDIEKVVTEIDAYRMETEKKVGESTAIELSTEKLRSKIAQKWSKIHFYQIDGELIRVKTYPHAEISKRTEEFYLMGGKLVTAVIEDNGADDTMPNEDNFNKVYYFKDGKFISEKNMTNEKEYKIKDSEAEELLQELEEYKEIFSNL